MYEPAIVCACARLYFEVIEMLTVISAPPGSGKSLHCVQILEDTVRKNPNRFIFTNIIGINIPGVLPIPSCPTHAPFDYRNLPNGSLLVYDEAHEHPSFSKNDLLKNLTLPFYLKDIYDSEVKKVLDYEKLSTHEKIKLLNKHSFAFVDLPFSLKVKEQEELVRTIRNLEKQHLERIKDDILDIGRSLTMHRHFGYDIVFVTQKPDLLNSYVKAATSDHLILRRLFKLPLAIIYSFSEVQDTFGNATRRNALSWKIWLFPKRLFKYYISSEDHTSKVEIPFFFKFAFFLILSLISLSVYRFFNTNFDFFKSDNIETVSTPVSTPLPTTTKSDVSTKAKSSNNLPDLTNICRMASNVDTPECKKWFDDLSKNGGSLGNAEFVYDGSKPFDVKYTPSDLQPTDFPRFKNTIVKNGKCIAFSQQGTIMHDVSKKDCFRLANGDRPFDYFKDPSNYENNPSTIAPDKPILEDTKTVQDAKVIVEPVPISQGTNLA